jgi:hypothetical protein
MYVIHMYYIWITSVLFCLYVNNNTVKCTKPVPRQSQKLPTSRLHVQWHLQASASTYRYLQAVTGICRHLQASAGTYMQIQTSTGICRNLQADTGICRHLHHEIQKHNNTENYINSHNKQSQSATRKHSNNQTKFQIIVHNMRFVITLRNILQTVKWLPQNEISYMKQSKEPRRIYNISYRSL